MPKIQRICRICESEFFVKPNVVRKGYGKYCSLACRSKVYIGSGNPKWRGGKTKIKGYVLIYCPDHPNRNKDGCVMEHRLVVEKSLGRYLERKEVVHHINGVKDDNRLNNLQLFDNHSQHFSHEISLGNIPLTYWKGKKRTQLSIDRQKKTWRERYGTKTSQVD